MHEICTRDWGCGALSRTGPLSGSTGAIQILDIHNQDSGSINQSSLMMTMTMIKRRDEMWDLPVDLNHPTGKHRCGAQLNYHFREGSPTELLVLFGAQLSVRRSERSTLLYGM